VEIAVTEQTGSREDSCCGQHGDAAPLAIDPVCGMRVSPDGPRRHVHAGVAYSFCCDRCLARFRSDPEAYLGAADRADAPQPPSGTGVEGARYTCPMHPEIVRDAPEPCPLCGMALEPIAVSAEPEESPELVDMRRRLWLSAAFTLPVLLMAMSEMLPAASLRDALPGALFVGAQLVLSTPVVLWGGLPFFERGWASVRSRSPNMFTLIALGTAAAYLYSVVATLAPGSFPGSFRGPDGLVAVYFEAAAVIVTLVLLGQVLELTARARTGSALRALLGLAPKVARRLADDGSEADVPLERIARGGLVMRPEHMGSETLLARIVQMVADAQRSRAPIQRLADSVARWFVPAVVATAVATFVV
jgi:Cu+-exporting ATPase